jgi:hypothetical protein
LNNPLKYTDPSGFVELPTIISNLLASRYGGSWSQGGGIYYFSSQDESFEAGVTYVGYSGGWAGTEYGSESASREIYDMVGNTSRLYPDIQLVSYKDQHFFDYNTITGKFYIPYTDTEINPYKDMHGETNVVVNEESNTQPNGIPVSDKTNAFLMIIQSPFSLMKEISSIKGGDIPMAKTMVGIKTTIGVTSVVTTGILSSLDGKFSIGDVGRVLSNLSYFIPYVGTAYGVLDIYYGINGYSLTDQFGDWVDYHWGDCHDVTPIFYRP